MFEEAILRDVVLRTVCIITFLATQVSNSLQNIICYVVYV